MTKRLAICIGLTRLNPASYGGWEGKCSGCDRDAARFAAFCHDRGFDGVTVLVNRAASKRNVKAAFIETNRVLRGGDLLVLYNSGHGGQQPDKGGDEADGHDETLLWWDGLVVDDTIDKYLRMVRPTVRVLLVSDTCNSGTNYRGGPTTRRSTPVRLTSRAFPDRLLHFGGCADGRASYGTEQGGVFTTGLLGIIQRARKPLTYREWFDRTETWMSGEQAPVFAEGRKSFADLTALE